MDAKMMNMEKKHDSENVTRLDSNTKLNRLADAIADLVTKSKGKLAQTINTVLVSTYWNIGKYIIDFEQQGNVRAEYGTALLSSLSKTFLKCSSVTFVLPQIAITCEQLSKRCRLKSKTHPRIFAFPLSSPAT